MYVVKVYRLEPVMTVGSTVVKTSRKLVETKEFPYGQWMEIAYWLDENGFISPDEYEVNVTFKREWDD